MAYSPIAFIAPNYSDYGTYWLKAYLPGSTTPKLLAIESTGTTTFAKLQLNVDGFFKSAGGALIIPHVEGAYDGYLFQTEAEADANNTAGAVRLADNITPLVDGELRSDLADGAADIGKLNPVLLSAVVSDTALIVGMVRVISDRANGVFDVVLASSVTANTFNIIACTGVNTLALVLRDDATVNIKQFGVVGSLDETAATQAAFTYSNNKKLVIEPDLNILITTTVTMPNNIVIDNRGKFTCTGDVDSWFDGLNQDSVIIENWEATITLAFASRTALNRCIRPNNPTYFEVKIALIDGASTAIHCLFGETAIFGDIRLTNVLGTAAQYGYGINSSAKRTIIDSLKIKNTDNTQGRHGIYINGGVWEFVSIGNIEVENFNKNPIQITNTGTGNKCVAYVGKTSFINCNLVPTTTFSGCIYVADGGGNAVVNLNVDTIVVDNVAGPAAGSVYGPLEVTIKNVYAKNVPVAANSLTPLVHFRNSISAVIEQTHCQALNTDWLSALSFRDVVFAKYNDVYVGGSLGSQAVRMVTSNVNQGYVLTESIDKTFDSGSTFTFSRLNQGFSYGTTAPSVGAYPHGHIQFNTAPAASGKLGWVATAAVANAAVDNSAFKLFAAIDA
jgi:hypothetical protein